MTDWIFRLWRGEAFRYLFFGGITVLVNVAAYQVFSMVWGSMTANTAAFFLAVLFAYWTNSTFVFRTPHTWKNFSQFMGMRIGTLFIDNGGMYLLLGLKINSLLAKCAVNAVIIIINYLMSKMLIFRKK